MRGHGFLHIVREQNDDDSHALPLATVYCLDRRQQFASLLLPGPGRHDHKIKVMDENYCPGI
jgi:hypothetical protein